MLCPYEDELTGKRLLPLRQPHSELDHLSVGDKSATPASR